jgi:hypothetical protein
MKFFGGLLMAIGILIAMPSGLCGAWLLIALVGDARGHDTSVIPSLMIVAVPFIIGIALFFKGRALVRLAEERSE